MLNKEEEEILEIYTKNDCCECDVKKENGFCPDCYVDEHDMIIISKILKKYKMLETREQNLIKKLEEESKQLDEETKAIAIKLNEARDFVITDEYEQAENDEYILILEEKYEKANIKRIRTNEILKILKGEANEELL